MDRKVKLTLAIAVLLLGATVAMLFRHPASPPQANKPSIPNQPLIRSWTDSPTPPVDAQPSPKQVTQTRPVRQPQALIRASLEENEPPPPLAPVYPHPDNAFPAEPTSNPCSMEPDGNHPALQIHIVAEGDTLPLLAERYLGSADRYMEIFTLNRERLATPDALRIGDELKIPPRNAPAKSNETVLPEQPLVPVR